jgi:predicted membrane chloride channel (bestrophin family)
MKSHHRLLLRVVAVVVLLMGAKIAVHYLGAEIITINPLFTGIIAANVFLMGFLLSGVIADYKESEKLPGELGACLENMAQEVVGMKLSKPEAVVGPALVSFSQMSKDIHDWFYKKLDTEALLDRVNGLTTTFAMLEPWTQASYLTRLKTEQSTLRRNLVRIEVIRETNFVAAGYMLAYVITGLLCLGLVLAQMDPFHESLTFTGVIAYLLVFLLMLIRDLDNPFGFYERFSGADVSLDAFRNSMKRLDRIAGVEESAGMRFVQVDVDAAAKLRAALDAALPPAVPGS